MNTRQHLAVIKAAIEPIGMEVLDVAARVQDMEARLPEIAQLGTQRALDLYLRDIRSGIDGRDGRDGKDGKDGAHGRDGRDGKDGMQGVGIHCITQPEDRSTAVLEFDNGERVTLELPRALDGVAGRDGRDGVDGAAGRDGRNGIDGAAGKDGKDGRDGVDGPAGPAGEPGAHGRGLDAPQYVTGVHRSGVVVTAFSGRTYVAVRDTAGAPGESPDWQRIGTHGMRYRGVLDPEAPGARFEVGDVYTNGGTFMVFDDGHHLIGHRALSPSDVRSMAKKIADDSAASVRDLLMRAIELAIQPYANALKATQDRVATQQAAIVSLQQQIDAQHGES